MGSYLRGLTILLAAVLLSFGAAHAGSTFSNLPAASQPLGGGTGKTYVPLDQGDGCLTQNSPCATVQSDSLRIGQPIQTNCAAINSPWQYQLCIDTSLSPTVLKEFIGITWWPLVLLDGTTGPVSEIGGGGGGGGINLRNTTLTANYTIGTNDNGVIFNNLGAAGTVAITLPAVASHNGWLDCFSVGTAQTVTVVPQSADQIVLGVTIGDNGAVMTSNTVNSSVCLIANNTNSWVAVSSPDGVWTLNGTATVSMPTVLSYLPLNPSLNLSDVANAATARANLAVLPLAGGTMSGGIISNAATPLAATSSTSFAPLVSLINQTADANGPNFVFQKGRASGTTTQSGDTLGTISFDGYGSGNAMASGAFIGGISTGAAGVSNIPSDLVFSTATSSAITEKMRITSSGNVNAGGPFSSVQNITAALTTDGSGILGQQNTITANAIYQMTTPVTISSYDALRGVAIATSGTTTTGVNGVAGYVQNQAGSTAPQGNSVALFGVGASTSNNAAVWGLNTVVTDNTSQVVSAGTGRVLWGGELDFNVTSPSTVVVGAQLTGNSLSQPAEADGFNVRPLAAFDSGPTPIHWNSAFWSQNGAATWAFVAGSARQNGANSNGQPIIFKYLDGSAAEQHFVLQANFGSPANLGLSSTAGVANLIVTGSLYFGGPGVGGLIIGSDVILDEDASHNVFMATGLTTGTTIGNATGGVNLNGAVAAPNLASSSGGKCLGYNTSTHVIYVASTTC